MAKSIEEKIRTAFERGLRAARRPIPRKAALRMRRHTVRRNPSRGRRVYFPSTGKWVTFKRRTAYP